MIQEIPGAGVPSRLPLSRCPAEVEREAAAVLEQVRRGGDRAIQELTLRFDGVRVAQSRVEPAEISAALQAAPAELVKALQAAATNLSRVACAQRFAEEEVSVRPGVKLWREWRPLRRVGIYVPGGRAPYPSSVVMLCAPARLAGCEEVVLCAPPGRDGRIHPHILAAAGLAGATEVHAIGGAQAIAAMAFGTETLAAVDKVFGPGNAHVTAAKRLVFGRVAVDMPAGPSEVVVVSDGSTPAAWLAADLEAQAEHAPDALGVLISTDPEHAAAVRGLLDPRLAAQVRVYRAESLEQALGFSNRFGPEHLILACRDPRRWLPRVQSAGSVFLGSHSPAAAGDYATGANHVIPTGGAVRSFSPLGLDDFGRTLQVQEITPAGLASLKAVIEPLARAEGFSHHLRSALLRMGSAPAPERAAPSPRRSVGAMHPYEWEASSAEIAARAGLREEEVVRFDTNTCPWAGATLGDLPPQVLHEYPDSAYPALVSAVADYTGLPSSAITVGAGADELLSLVATAYVAPLDPVVIPDPSYAMFRVLTEAAGGQVITVPADSPDRLLEAGRHARLTWVCNPNNPTGGLLPPGLVEELALASPGVVVADEAYYEFSGATSAGLVLQLPNLVVVRTLSKAFGLAGARVGYALSGPELAATLARVRPPAGVSSCSAALATHSLEAAGEMRARVLQLRRWGRALERQIQELGFQVRMSAANFLLVTCPAGLPDFLAARGLVVRAFGPAHALGGWMRVTIRSEPENARLLEGLASWRASRDG